MLSKKVKSRIFFLFFLSILAVAIIFFILRSLEENVVYFLSPTEIYNKTDIPFKKKIRVGGLVKINSVNKAEHQLVLLLPILTKKLLYLTMVWCQIYFQKEKEWLLRVN